MTVYDQDSFRYHFPTLRLGSAFKYALSVQRWYYLYILLCPRLYDLSPSDVKQRQLPPWILSFSQTVHLPVMGGTSNQQPAGTR